MPQRATLNSRFPTDGSVQRPSIQLVTPDTQAQISATRLIFSEYTEQLGVDLCFQNFDDELADLPGEYASPQGALLLALVDGEVAGCCALRPLHSVDYPNAAEMKRLYVRRPYRGSGLGRQLAEATLDAARVAGYHSVLLDTLVLELVHARIGEQQGRIIAGHDGAGRHDLVAFGLEEFQKSLANFGCFHSVAFWGAVLRFRGRRL